MRLGIMALLAIVAMTATPAMATPPFDSDAEADAFCAVRVEGNPVTFCGSLNLTESEALAICGQHQVQICEPYAEQICGDCLDLDLAVQLNSTRMACQHSSELALATSNSCNSVANNQLTCPDVNVEVKQADVQCKKCRFRHVYRERADGTQKLVRTVKVCKGPCTIATDVNID